MLLSHARLPARLDIRGPGSSSSNARPSGCGQAEIAEGVRVLPSALLHADRGTAPGPRPAMPPSPPCTTTRRAPRSHLRISSPVRRPPSPQPPTLCAMTRRGARPLGRVGHGPRRRRRHARYLPAARRVIGERPAGTPSASTCTSGAATCPPPPRPTPRRPAGPRTSPSATPCPPGRPLASRLLSAVERMTSRDRDKPAEPSSAAASQAVARAHGVALRRGLLIAAGHQRAGASDALRVRWRGHDRDFVLTTSPSNGWA